MKKKTDGVVCELIFCNLKTAILCYKNLITYGILWMSGCKSLYWNGFEKLQLRNDNIKKSNFDVSLTVHLSITLANDQRDAQILIHLLPSSTCTCFEQYLVHPEEVKYY